VTLKPLLAALCLAAPMAAAPLIDVAAKVGGDIITTADLDQAVEVLKAQMSPEERNSAEGKKKLDEARGRVLDRMIEEKLVVLAAKDGPPGFKEAADQGKAPSNPFLPAGSDIEAEMEKLFDEARGRFKNQDDFEEALKSERTSIPEFRNRLRERVRDQMTYSRMAKFKEQEFRSSMRVGEDEMLAFYNENKERFAQGEQVKLRHILFPAGSEAQAKSVLAELKKASNVKDAFIAAARKYSADAPTKDQGGNLDWIEKGQSWPEIEDAAFKAKDGSLLGPIKSDAGLHLLYVEGHQSGKAHSFDDVKANVRNLLYQQKNQKRLAEWVDELKRKYYVERKEPALKPE
jgi:parvulin-like peptidyl-prolyl isomerase